MWTPRSSPQEPGNPTWPSLRTALMEESLAPCLTSEASVSTLGPAGVTMTVQGLALVLAPSHSSYAPKTPKVSAAKLT